MKLLLLVSIISASLPIIMSQGEGEVVPEVPPPPPPEPAPEPPPPAPAAESVPEAPPTPPAAEATPVDTPAVPQETVPTGGEDLSGKSAKGRPGPENNKRDPTPWVCYQKVKPGPCRAYIKRWYYSKKSASCKQFIYGGCRGNSNSFWTKKECEKFCQTKGSDMGIMARSYWVEDGMKMG